MKEETLINKGMSKYDVFVKRILGHNKVMTPRTQILEKLGLLDINSRDFIGIALKELSTNFEIDYELRVFENKLYKVWQNEELEEF